MYSLRKFRREQLQSYIWLKVFSYMTKYLCIYSYIHVNLLLCTFKYCTWWLVIHLHCNRAQYWFSVTKAKARSILNLFYTMKTVPKGIEEGDVIQCRQACTHSSRWKSLQFCNTARAVRLSGRQPCRLLSLVDLWYLLFILSDYLTLRQVASSPLQLFWCNYKIEA